MLTSFALAAAFSLLGASPASAALTKGFPLPGGEGDATSAQSGEAVGRAGGKLNTYAGAPSFGSYSQLFWGPASGMGGFETCPTTANPCLAMDGNVDNVPVGERMTFQAGSSNLPGGVAVWTGLTRVSAQGTTLNVDTRFTLTTTVFGGGTLPMSLGSSQGLDAPVVVAVPASGFRTNLLYEAKTAGGGTFVPALNYFDGLALKPSNTGGFAKSSFAGAYYWNRPPTVAAQNLSVNEDAPLSIALGGSDPDGNALTYSTSSPANGVLTGTGASRTFTPDPNYFGSTSFLVNVNDGLVTSALATVSITVDPVNDVPVAAAQSVSTPEDAALGITLTGTDIENSPLTYTVTGSPSNGSLSGDAPDLTYTPNANYFGADSFTFTVNDGTVDSPEATVAIAITPVNDAPTVTGQSLSTDEDVALVITLAGSDIENDVLGFAVVDAPANGTAVLAGDTVTYTPNLDYNGADSFTFLANDGDLDSNVETIAITINPINDAPVATAQSLGTDEDAPLVVTLAATDVENDVLTFEVVDQPTNGALSGVAPALVYTPNLDYNGADSFTFKANDGALDSAVATVDIAVAAVNDTPTVTDSSAETDEDVAVAVPLTAADVDGDVLTWTVNLPANGTLSGDAPDLTYTPNLNYNGPDSFTFTVNDGMVDSAVGTVSITVNGVNDTPVADALSVTTDEDTPADITLTAVDVENDPLSFEVLTQPLNGTLSGEAPTITYTPNLNFNGTDAFTFAASDGLLTSTAAAVSITVNPINDAPVADAVSLATDEDTAADITVTGSDVENDALTFSVVDQPANGSVTGDGPLFNYTPNLNFNGADSFTVKANDGLLDSAPATISVSVNAVNDIPVADAASVTTDEDTALAITLTGSDIDGDALTFAVVGDPANGELGGSAPNLTYTPDFDYNGSDSFSFTVNDGQADSPAATVSITVNAVNDAPRPGDDEVTMKQYEVAVIDVLANDGDPESDGFSVVAVSTPGHGTATIDPEGTVTYRPDTTFKERDEFTYTVRDVHGAEATATVTILEDLCGETGPVTTPIDKTVEPAVGSVDRDLAASLHDTNCSTLVPLEDVVEDQL